MDNNEKEEAVPEPESPPVDPSKVKVFEAILIKISKGNEKDDNAKE